MSTKVETKPVENEILIKELTIKLGKKEISLTVDEAKKLKKSLEDLFGKEVIKEVVHEHHYDWYYRYLSSPSPYVSNPPYTVWCGSDATSGTATNITAHNANLQGTATNCLVIDIA